MKKIILIILIVTIQLSSFSQPWSKTLTADNLSTSISFAPNSGGPSVIIPEGAFEVKKDAVAVNRANGSSVYPIHSLFTFYSLDPNSVLLTGATPFPIPSVESLWLVISDDNGNVLNSKSVEIPSGFNYGFANPVQQMQSREFLIVNSLAYTDDDVLVFTGEIESKIYSNASGSISKSTLFRTMVIGSYDLKNDQVELEYIDSPTKSVPTGTIHINSYGTGLVHMPDNGYYQAIGRTMNYTNTSFQMENPAVIVFDVDAIGGITVIQKEGFDFRYLPISADKYISAYESITVGEYFPNNPVATPCSNYTSAVAGLGVFNFKYNSALNNLTIGEFAISYSEDYETNRSANNDLGSATVYYDDQNALTYVAYNASPNLGHDYIVVGEIDLNNQGMGDFYRVDVEKGLGVETRLGQITDKDSYAQLSFKINDLGKFNQKNSNSMGLVDLHKGNFSNTLLNAKQLYSNDDFNDRIRDFGNITAIGINDGSRFKDYYLADGEFMKTDKSRAHIYGVVNQDFNGICVEEREAEMSRICSKYETYHQLGALWENLNTTQYALYTTSNYRNCVVGNVSGKVYDCMEFKDRIGSFRLSKEQLIVDEVVGFEYYPNPGTNQLEIILEESNEEMDINIQLLDLTGRVMMDESYTTNVINMNVFELPSGTYILRVIRNGKITNKKWVKY